MAATETAAHRKNSGSLCRVSASSRHWLRLIDSLTTNRRGYSNSCNYSLYVEIHHTEMQMIGNQEWETVSDYWSLLKPTGNKTEVLHRTECVTKPTP
jgi:hypothetical protein